MVDELLQLPFLTSKLRKIVLYKRAFCEKMADLSLLHLESHDSKCICQLLICK